MDHPFYAILSRRIVRSGEGIRVLRELRKADWLAILQLDESRIPLVLILRGTRNLKRHFDSYRAILTDPLDVGSPNGLFEDVVIGERDGRTLAYASVYGPAMASEITHVFGVLGTKAVIQTGVCGGLGDGVRAGDLVVATEAACGEGAVECYLPGTRSVAASERLVQLAAAATGAHPFHMGAIWTTAALLAEGEADLVRWRDGGAIAVDMETATTFGVAEWAGMERVSILTVFDNPLEGDHLGLQAIDKTEARAAGERQMLEVVLEVAAYAG
jgi:uridine phosphorylase